MVLRLAELAQAAGDLGERGSIGVLRVTHNPNAPVNGYRACRPPVLPIQAEPEMSFFVSDMGGIVQCQQNIYIQ